MKPEISIIIPNLNHAQYITQAVDSILKQTLQNIEIIIVDDCSTDDSPEIINNISGADARIAQPILLKENRGKWFALNSGIEKARADLIAVADADDVSSIYRLERQLKVLKDNGSYHNLCGFVHCHSQQDIDKASLWTPSGPVQDKDVMGHEEVLGQVYKGFKTPGINHYYVGQNYEVHGASTLFYKQFWNFGLKFMPGNMGLRSQKAEDSAHNTSLTLLLQKTSVLKEPLYFYRRNTSTNGAWLEAK
jgi:glycosyltransferase involved in cell wall biosynthesis